MATKGSDKGKAAENPRFRRALSAVMDTKGKVVRTVMQLTPANPAARTIHEAAERLVKIWDEYMRLKHEVDNLRAQVRGPILEQIGEIEDVAAKSATVVVRIGEALLVVSRAAQRTVKDDPEKVADRFVEAFMAEMRRIGKMSEEELAATEKLLRKLRDAVVAASVHTTTGQRALTPVTTDEEREKLLKGADEPKLEEAAGDDAVADALDRIVDVADDVVDRLVAGAGRILARAKALADRMAE